MAWRATRSLGVMQLAMVRSGADTAVDGSERAVLGTLAELGNASRTALRHAQEV